MTSTKEVALAAIASLVLAGCYVPHETRGGLEAMQIHRRRHSQVGRHAGAEAPHGPMSADVAIQLAKANSAKLAELSARAEAFEAAVGAAGQRNNPELRATNVRVARAIDLGEDVRVVPRIRYSPERPGFVGAREAEARAASRAARAEERAEADAIEAEVRWFFDDIVLLDAEIAAYERVAATRRKLATRTRDQLATGMATAVDASLAELSAVEAEVHAAERRSRRRILAAALSDRLGVGVDAELALAGEPTAWPPPPLPTEEALIEAALKRSPRVSSAAARIDETAARLDREKTRRWPWFSFVEVGYELDRTATNVPLWTVGAGVDLPILSANTGAIRQAEAARAEAKRHLETEVEKIEREVRARLREANAAATLVTEFRKAALPALEAADAEAARALESGSIDAERALVVEERSLRVQIELLRLVRQYRTAIDGLRRAVGGPLPPANEKGDIDR